MSSFLEERRSATERQQREHDEMFREATMAQLDRVAREDRANWATIDVPQRLEALERAAQVEAERTDQRHRQVLWLMRWTLFASAMAVFVGIGGLLLAWLAGGSP